MRALFTLGFLLLMPLTVNAEAQTPSADIQAEINSILSLRPVRQLFTWFRSHEAELRRLQIELVEVPAPPFKERERAEWIRERFRELGLQKPEIDKAGNVTALLPGADLRAPLVALTAHLDTVFPAGTDVNVKTQGDKLFAPGISDNGAGLTALLGLATALQEVKIQPKSGILFVANVGEEGEGNLRGMRYLFEQSKWKDRIGETVVLDGAGVDSVVMQALGSRRFEVTVRGPGGHSWSDFGTPNPIVVLGRAIARLSEVPVPTNPRSSLNVGVISGGKSVNSIPETASMRVDIRSASKQEIERLAAALNDAVQSAVKSSQGAKGEARGIVQADIREIGNRPAADLDPSSRIAKVITAADKQLGIEANTRLASTDANIPLSMGRPAISIGAGGTGGGAHTDHEWYDPAGRELGLRRITLTLLTLTGVNE